MRLNRHEDAHRLLIEEARQIAPRKELFLIEISNPVEFLMRAYRIGRGPALALLKELEKRRWVSVERDGGNGRTPVSVRILRELAPSLHERDEEDRFLGALLDHRLESTEHPGTFLLHSRHFSSVERDADLTQPRLYLLLKDLEQRGWVERVFAVKNGRETIRILLVRFTDEFPVSLEAVSQ